MSRKSGLTPAAELLIDRPKVLALLAASPEPMTFAAVQFALRYQPTTRRTRAALDSLLADGTIAGERERFRTVNGLGMEGGMMEAVRYRVSPGKRKKAKP